MVGSISHTISGKAPRCLRTNRHEACHCSGSPALLAMHLTPLNNSRGNVMADPSHLPLESHLDFPNSDGSMASAEEKILCSTCMKWPGPRAACISRRSTPNDKPLQEVGIDDRLPYLVGLHKPRASLERRLPAISAMMIYCDFARRKASFCLPKSGQHDWLASANHKRYRAGRLA